MKASIDMDEWWPVYTFDFDPREAETVEVTDADRADYERVMAEFKAWQQRIEDLWEQGGEDR